MSKRPIVVKLGGTNGSGKSTVAFGLLSYPHEEFHDDLAPGKRPAGYVIHHPKARIRLLGPYATQCGGVDALRGGIATWFPLMEKYRLNAEDDILVFEGILSGQTFGRCGELSETEKEHWIYAFMDTPLEVAGARVLARRAAKGNDKPFDPATSSMATAFKACARTETVAREKGFSVLRLRHERTGKQLANDLVTAALKAAEKRI